MLVLYIIVLCLCLVIFVLSIINFIDGSAEGEGSRWKSMTIRSFICSILSFIILATSPSFIRFLLNEESKESPKAIDVYRGKTKMKIIDSDTTVIWKDESEYIYKE